MPKNLLLCTAALTLLLQGCGTVRPAPLECPKPPAPLVRAPTGLNWQESMQNFLLGTPHALPSKTPLSPPATPASTPRGPIL